MAETNDKHTETHARDLIDRQAALDALNRLEYTPGEWATNGLTMCKDAIKALPSAQPDVPGINVIIDTIKNAINASTGNDAYTVGLRNGMKWCWSALTDKEPEYEDIPFALQWIPCSECEKRCGKWEHLKI